MSTAIEFENISKQYRLGLVSTGTLSHDLNRFWQTKVLRREDPYLKVGEVNDRAHKGASEYVWALKDINFKVEQGDVVGIIGRNGAGKSTLLKLLSRVTAPTTGTIRARGRIASLLEVGTGFHPEMTGRENIYMNGAIMGMSRAEITRKLDEIVDFSGCERYLDTPVKRYSSGMTVRLGLQKPLSFGRVQTSLAVALTQRVFAIAAHGRFPGKPGPGRHGIKSPLYTAIFPFRGPSAVNKRPSEPLRGFRL